MIIEALRRWFPLGGGATKSEPLKEKDVQSFSMDDEKSGRQLRRLLLCLIGLTGILLMLAAYLAKETIESNENTSNIKHRLNFTFVQIKIFQKIQSELGYTYFIHNFKNGILRQDFEKLDEAQKSLLTITKLLDQFLAVSRETQWDYQLLQPVGVLKITLLHYSANIDVAKEMFLAGASIQEVDDRVKINDDPARVALDQIGAVISETYNQLHGKLNQQTQIHNNRLNILIGTSVGLLVVGMLLLSIYVLIRRHLRIINEAREHLAAMSDRMHIQINAIADEFHQTGRNGAGTPDTGHQTPMGLSRIKRTLRELASQTELQQRELQKYIQELELSNEELKRFAYVASHDLQEPLRKIQTNIDLIEHRCADQLTEDVSSRLARVTKAANSMRQLIDDLLAYSRSGTQTLTYQMVDLSDLCSRITDEFQYVFKERGGTVTSTLSAGPSVYGDKSQLTQMITNLLSNAAKYCAPEDVPVAHLTLSFTDDMAIIEVADQGIGFEAQYAEQIFEPFRRLHGRGAYEGSGIGLSIVKRVAQRHGGKVSARPGDKGGAIFTLILPTVAENSREER